MAKEITIDAAKSRLIRSETVGAGGSRIEESLRRRTSESTSTPTAASSSQHSTRGESRTCGDGGRAQLVDDGSAPARRHRERLDWKGAARDQGGVQG